MAHESARLPVHFAPVAAGDLRIDPKELTIEDPIGAGKFSTVYRGSYRGATVAVKKQRLRTDDGKDLQTYIFAELSILKNCNHPNLIKYIGGYIVNEDRFKTAVVYLHAVGIVHRDVKPHNALLDADGVCKLCDMGFARRTTTARPMTICGTDEYMAPEVIFGETYDERADVFSFGVMVAEFLTLERSGSGVLERHPRDMFRLDMDALRAALPSDCPTSLVELAAQCLNYEAEMRPDAECVVEWIESLQEDMGAPSGAGAAGGGGGASAAGDVDRPPAHKRASSAGPSVAPLPLAVAEEAKAVGFPLPDTTGILSAGSTIREEAEGEAGTPAGADADVAEAKEEAGSGASRGDAASSTRVSLLLVGSPDLGESPFHRTGSSGSLVCQGYLTKRGGWFKSWNRRFFVLEPSRIAYYANDAAYRGRMRPRGYVSFSDVLVGKDGVAATVVSKDEINKPFCFSVKTKDRVYYMFAPDEVMQDRWVARINEVIALVRRAPRRGKQPEKDEEGGGAV